MFNLNQTTAPRVSQLLLERLVRKLFPQNTIIVNARKESLIEGDHVGNYLEIDIWLPVLKMGFEFQDSHHYFSTWHSNVPLELLQDKDLKKREKIHKREETLVSIPFWWDGSEASLVAGIRFQRPDLLLEHKNIVSPLIPLSSPIEFRGIPGVGELMLANFLNYLPINISPDNPWWMGEKYDGSRVCWNPIQKILYSRSGAKVDLRPIFVSSFGDSFLDGEIWFGRGFFHESQRIFGSSLSNIPWDSFRMIAFDDPAYSNHFLPFEKRYANILLAIPLHSPFLVVASRVMSKNTKHVKITSEIIMEDGGEGVIIRKKGSTYHNGRSDSLLKLKTIRADREALVIDVINGTFYLQLPDGVTTFQIGEENIKLDILPEKGDVVTFSYETYSTRAIPVDAQVFRIRKDVTWENIVRDYYENSDNIPDNFPKIEENKNKKKPYGYYKHNKHSNARRILETIAKQNNFDPLVPENWYQFTIKNFRKQQGGDQVYMMYGNSLSKALVDQFPEVEFDLSQFSTIDYWSSIDNRKNLLLKYAKRHNFDPLVADNWYTTTIESLSKIKGGKYMLVFYSGSPAKAISHLFPELKLDFEKFASVPRGYWNNQENRRNFFIKFAKKRGFDPLVAGNWYGISFEDYTHQNKGATTLLHYHNNSFQTAVVDLFPEIGVDISKFFSKQKRHWEDIRNRRKEFENIAESLGFDPLVADNWYKTKINEIRSFKIQAMLLNYRGDPVRALCELFPELNLDPSKFSKVKKINIYDEMRNRKRFFVDFAAANHFDPLVADNWYNIKIEDIFAAKGTWIIGMYKKSVVEALLDAFPEIGLNEFKFSDLDMHWSSKSVRRNTMERVAKEFDFDPLVLKNWLNSNVIEKVAPLLYFYDHDITKAVKTLFPETYRGIGVPRYPKFTRKRKVRNTQKIVTGAYTSPTHIFV